MKPQIFDGFSLCEEYTKFDDRPKLYNEIREKRA